MTTQPPAADDGDLVRQVTVLADAVFPFARANADDSWSIEALQSIGHRWKDARAAVVIAGEVSTGKSQLLNALIGQELLPTDFKAKSSTWVQLSHAPDFRAHAQLRLGEDTLQWLPVIATDLDVYLSVDGEGQLRKRHGRDAKVLTVEIGVPSPLLAQGLILIDTPGVGGLDAAHRLAALSGLTNADAVIVTTKPGQPISVSERRFLAEAIDRVDLCLLVSTHRDQVAEPDEALRQDLALLTDAAEWTAILGGDAIGAAALAERLRTLPAVSVSSVNALAAQLVDGDARQRLVDAANVTVLEEMLARDVLGRVVEIHRRRIVTLCRRLSTGIATTARERHGLLSGAGDAVAALEHRQRRLHRWREGNGDFWRKEFTEELNAGLRTELSELATRRSDELKTEYWTKMADLSRAELQTTVDALRETPGAVLTEMLALAGDGIAEATARVRTLLVEDDLDRPLADLQAAADAGRNLRPEWVEPDAAPVSTDDLVRGLYGGMAGAGVTSLVVTGLANAGVALPFASIPILWPFAIGATAMSFWTYRKRQKQRTVEQARELLAEVRQIIVDDVVDRAWEASKQTADVVMAEIEAGLDELAKRAADDQALIADAARLAADPAERRARLDGLAALAAEADAFTARADELLDALPAAG